MSPQSTHKCSECRLAVRICQPQRDHGTLQRRPTDWNRWNRCSGAACVSPEICFRRGCRDHHHHHHTKPPATFNPFRGDSNEATRHTLYKSKQEPRSSFLQLTNQPTTQRDAKSVRKRGWVETETQGGNVN